MRAIRPAIAIAVAALALAGCGGGDASAPSGGASTPTQMTGDGREGVSALTYKPKPFYDDIDRMQIGRAHV